MSLTLGPEIRRLRTAAGFTLRDFAKKLGISAAYQSDIEHDRRRPPDPLLRKMVQLLAHVGARYEALEQLDTRMDPEIRVWANATPGVREMLRKMRDSGQDPREILRKIEEAETLKRKPKP
jgi:transcriptional regulator with XRE-family HTH domain